MKKLFSLTVWKLGLPIVLALFMQVVFFQLLKNSSAQAELAPQAPATGPCVNPGGTDGCHTSIQAAINAASSGDIVTVATGTYHEHIRMRNQVSVYGSGMFNTIIDGGFTSPSATVRMDQVNAGTVLSGVQVTGGGLHDLSGILPDGGGIYIGYANATVNNTWVYSCTARWGGGIFIQNAKATLNNVSITNSRAKENGGGINIMSDKEVTILADPFDLAQGLIMFNTANQGAGIFANTSATVTIAGAHIFWNTASGSYGNAGGVYLMNASGRVNLWLNQINSNTAKTGGGLYSENSSNLDIVLNNINDNIATLDAGGAFINQSQGNINNNWFMNNQANNYGGGIDVFYNASGPKLSGNWIEGNQAGFGGGLVLMVGAAPPVEGNVFTKNRAVSGAGIGLFQSGIANIANNIIAQNVATTIGLLGAGVMADSSPARLINNTISDNTGDGILLSQSENIVIANNIINGNSGDGLQNDAYYPTVSYTADYNDVYGNSPNYTGLVAGVHDQSLSPGFAGSGDIWAFYHLLESSPVRHTGSSLWAPLFDIDSEVRLAPVSMGADELDPTYSLFMPLIRR